VVVGEEEEEEEEEVVVEVVVTDVITHPSLLRTLLPKETPSYKK
jgi:hypothetical protein